MTYSLIGISICILGVILLNTFLIYKINKATDVSIIKLSLFWKMILLTLIIGGITLYMDFRNTYNSIHPASDADEVSEIIQVHIIHGLFYLMIVFLTIVNLMVIRHYRQLKYNKTHNENK